jgi:hypothetical protein
MHNRKLIISSGLVLRNRKMRSAIAIISCIAAAVALTRWSARIGQKVWSPQVFAWRNPLKPHPRIERQAGCPVSLIKPRFYSFMSLGSSIGSVFKLDVKNVSDKPVHSFNISFRSSDPLDTGAIGVQPETILRPEHAFTAGHSSRGNDQLAVCVDFVQFADGDVWYPEPTSEYVKPEGVRVGARASIEYLRRVLENEGAAAVMDVLPAIQTKVEFPDAAAKSEVFGTFGFYCGVTNTVVRVEDAYQKRGLTGVEEFFTQ